MPFLDGKPVIITKRNIDKHGNPISVKRIETKQVVDIHNSIPLNYSIDRNHPIVIDGMFQIFNQDEISENTFFADYDQGILYFHPKKVGNSLTVTYMSTGYILISSSRIYRYNTINGSNAHETIEASFEKLENLLNTLIQGGGNVGGAIEAEVIGSRTDAEGTTYPSLGDRLNHITQKLDQLTTILKYTNTKTLQNNAKTVEVGINEYDPKTDTLDVYLSGVKMIEGIDYTLNKDDKSITNVRNEWLQGDQLHFVVLKKATDTTIGGGGGGGGALPGNINASSVILTTPIFGSNNAQSAFIQIETILNNKADKTDLNKYLPLAGGTVTGNLKVEGSTTVKTVVATDSSDNAASTAFVRNNIGFLSGLTTTNKTNLVAAINEINNKGGQAGTINQEVIDARTDINNHQFGSLGLRLNSMQNDIKGKVDATALNNYLPLAGGNITGNLSVAGNLTAQTVAATDSSTKVATTSFVRSNVGILANLNTKIKDNLVNAINEINTGLAGVNKEINDAKTSINGVTHATLDGRLDKIENDLSNTATKNMLDGYLPLTGGTVNGVVTVNNSLHALTPLSKEDSNRVATTEWVKILMGGELNTLTTKDKTGLINAINEVKDMCEQLNGDGFIYNVYTNVVNVDRETKTVETGIDNYDPSKGDRLDVYLAGARLLPNIGFTYNEKDKTVSCGNGNWKIGDQLFFELTKRERLVVVP